MCLFSWLTSIYKVGQGPTSFLVIFKFLKGHYFFRVLFLGSGGEAALNMFLKGILINGS